MDYKISIVIPLYNEQDRIESTVRKINQYFSNVNFNYELIFVNDGSTDYTARLLTKIKNELNLKYKNCHIIILNNEINSGKGFSVIKGVLASKGKYILFTDADLSTDISEEEKLLDYLKNGYSISIASRGLRNSKVLKRQNILRQSMGRFFNFLVKIVLKLDYRDTQCGFKYFDRQAVNKIFPYLKINNFCFDVEILYLAKINGLKVKEVPVNWVNSKDSKVRIFRDSFNMFFSLFKIKKTHKDNISILVRNKDEAEF